MLALIYKSARRKNAVGQVLIQTAWASLDKPLQTLTHTIIALCVCIFVGVYKGIVLCIYSCCKNVKYIC